MNHRLRLLLPLGVLWGCSTTPDETDLLAPDELVLSAYDDTITVLDVDDPTQPALVTQVALGGRATGVGWPALSPDRSAFLWAQPDGIYRCDAPDCQTIERLTPDWPGGGFGWFDQSADEGRIVFEVWEEYGAGQNDVWTMAGDGSELLQIWSVLDEFPMLPNDDQMQIWGSGEVAFSPDGQRILLNTTGHCSGPDEDHPALCLNDFYSVLYSMGWDGTDRREEAWTVGEGVYGWMSWAGNGRIYGLRWDDLAQARLPFFAKDGAETLLEGDLGDPCLIRSSPLAAEDGLMVNPCYTGDLAHHQVTGTTIGAATTLQVEDPNAPDSTLAVFSWFRWQR